ncbi:MAG: CoB--CoM heterodisulfide reductase iron-sulfur subunit B family protein [Candidatus Cloacimonadota bacterium]|nr:CoB--CoM heterodisulfide reductase iron-sulfur subunit B family protein [Candidatus Cloacimonadota bacterium]
MKIPYFPGCSLKTSSNNFEKSAIATGEVLDIEFVELPRWNCCGVVSSLTNDDLMHHLAPVRNFVRVLDMNKEGLVENENRLLTLCSMCNNTLKRSNQRVQENKEELDALNDFMYKETEYDGSVDVVHYLEILRDLGFEKVKEKVKVDLSNLNVAAYYGCMLIRPKEVGIDDPETPRVFENLVSSLTANPVEWRAKIQCCGSYLTVNKEDLVVNMSYKILEDAKQNGADIIVTTCPLCAFNLDNRQKQMKKKHLDFKTIPVLYFTQLMAVAFGLGEEEMAFDMNYIDPVPILKEKKILE